MSVKIKIDAQKTVEAIISKKQIDAAAGKLAQFIYKMIIDRINSGYDLHGEKFGGYNRSYDKGKAYKSAVKRFGKTKFASSSEGDKLRLTGHLLSSIRVIKVGSTNSPNRIEMKFVLSVPPAYEPQQIGLESTTGYVRTKKGVRGYSKKAWYFMGISKRLGEDKAIKRYLTKLLDVKNARVSTDKK